MTVSYKYWDDCLDPDDMKSMWMDEDVSKEWIDAGERMGEKVHLSRDPDGEPYLTPTEIRAVAEIVIHRHFNSQIDSDMICAIAEIGSGRQLLAEKYEKKTKETRIGITQIVSATAEWLVREMGYRNYDIEGDPTLLYRPFVNVYFAAAYLKWLFSYDGKERNEEYVVRAYNGGPKKATRKSTLEYFERYIFVKQNLPPKRGQKVFDYQSLAPDASNIGVPASNMAGSGNELLFWDSRASQMDMEELWKNPDVLKEWTKSGERRGKVRFSLDSEKRPYLSRAEVKAVAEIIISRHFNSRVQPEALASLAELCSMRFVSGVAARTGLMGVDYPTASWLYKDLGYSGYKVSSVDDLYNPFVSMYFGAAYVAWLSEFEGRERSHQFVVQAYMGGPHNVNLQETGPIWNKFLEILSYYQDPKKEQGSCRIL